MARIRMVTRTVTTNEFTVLTVNMENGTPEMKNEFYTLGAMPEGTDYLKELKKEYETDTVKLVSILDHKVEEQLYGMSEARFIQVAEKLPPRTTEE